MSKRNNKGSGRAILMCAGEYEMMEILRGAEDLVIAVDGGLSRLLQANDEIIRALPLLFLIRKR